MEFELLLRMVKDLLWFEVLFSEWSSSEDKWGHEIEEGLAISIVNRIEGDLFSSI